MVYITHLWWFWGWIMISFNHRAYELPTKLGQLWRVHPITPSSSSHFNHRQTHPPQKKKHVKDLRNKITWNFDGHNCKWWNFVTSLHHYTTILLRKVLLAFFHWGRHDGTEEGQRHQAQSTSALGPGSTQFGAEWQRFKPWHNLGIKCQDPQL